MTLNNIKNITTTARNNLVNAIRTKGVSIADDSTINQCANAIMLITGGDSMKFYKCASIAQAQSNAPTSQYPTYQINNANVPGYNGVYTYIGAFGEGDTKNVHLWQNSNDYYIAAIQSYIVVLCTVAGLNKENKTLESYAFLGYNDSISWNQVLQGTDNFYLDQLAMEYRWTVTKVEAPAAQPQDIPKTWSGYQLLFQDGIYKVSDTITQNLTYSSVVPKVGSVYTADALIKIGMYYTGVPVEGLVFYASLNGKTPDTAETGQHLSQVNANESQPVQYTTVNGVSCASFGTASYGDDCGYGGLSFDASVLPQGSNPRTISFWVKLTPTFGNDYCFFYGNYSRGNMVGIHGSTNFNSLNFTYHGDDAYLYGFDFTDKLHHVALVFNGPTNADITYYFDGIRQEMQYYAYGDININTYGGTCYIGCGKIDGLSRFSGWMSSIRVYDRALSQDEITILAEEFTPTTEDVPAIPPPEGGIVAGKPSGYRLKLSYYDLNPVRETEFVQDDLSATGKARTWTSVEDSAVKIIYSEDFGGWASVSIYDWNGYMPIPDRTGFGTGEDPYPCSDDLGAAEITVIE